MKSIHLKQLLRFTTASLFTMVLTSSPIFAADNEQVTVFAAASLTNALNEIGQQYEKEHNTKVIFSFASSSTLAKQVAMVRPPICLSRRIKSGWIIWSMLKRSMLAAEKSC